MAAPPQRDRQGQAIAEFAVTIVAMLVVVAGLLQIGLLSRAHTQVMQDARTEAGLQAFTAAYTLPLPGPRYILDWTPGPDGRTYSRDDEPNTTAPDAISAGVVQYAHPADLARQVPDNQLSPMQASLNVLPAFALVHGHKESDSIPLYPVVRRLLYNRDSITVEGDAWLVWTGGIY